jgi:hypothetical protein
MNGMVTSSSPMVLGSQSTPDVRSLALAWRGIPAPTRGEESANIMSSRARGGSQLFDCNMSSQNLFLKKLALGKGLALKISPPFRGPALA